MALIEQVVRRRPFFIAFIASICTSMTGLGSLIIAIIPFFGTKGIFFSGIVSDRRNKSIEHPLRIKILETLTKKPGLCYRELQKELDAANGTLRHHIDVLRTHRSLTIVRVNGRTCHYAGAPSQMKVIRSMGIEDDTRAASLMPVGLSEAQKLVISELRTQNPPRTQAELGRRIGRTRATVHSAVKVLKDRGLILFEKFELAPHLEELFAINNENKTRKIDYEWNDERFRSSVT
jgi:predicted transcriptional regulator